MKILSLFVLLVSSLLFAQSSLPTGADLCSHGKQQRFAASDRSLTKFFSPNAPKHSYDVLHYALDLDLYKNYTSPFPRSFKGAVTIRLKTDTILTSIPLDAVATSITVDSVRGAGVSFGHVKNVLTVQLDRSYQPQETLSVIIHYRHKDVIDEAFYVGSDGMVFTDAEPEGARKWFPCWDRPSDKATMELRAKVPATVKLGSNGVLSSTVKDGDTLWYHWKSDEPVATYLIVISSKVNYNLDIVHWKRPSDPKDSIPMYFYWNTGESQTGLNNIKAKIIPMTDRFSALFGEHPFRKNGFATMNNQFTWGGMENQTLTSLLPNGYTNENLVSHEFAHQWFGDMITCATWADIWLNEGFATYSEALWYEYTTGYNRYKTDIVQNANAYMSANPGRPIYVPAWATVTPSSSQLFNTAMTYYKGSCVLHMLRYVLGDSLFFSTVKSYGTDPQFKFSSATTDDFIAKMSSAAGRDLTWFFDQWVKTANHPNYAITYSYNTSANSAWVRIGQTQSVGFWKMPIELKFWLTNGTDTTITVFNDSNGEEFTFNFPAAPFNIAFDPDNEIVLKTVTAQEVTSVDAPGSVVRTFALEQNFPNPFNPSTEIRFSLETEAQTQLRIMDVLGRLVDEPLNQLLGPGVHSVTWNADRFPSGIYFYQLSSGIRTETRRMLLLR